MSRSNQFSSVTLDAIDDDLATRESNRQPGSFEWRDDEEVPIVRGPVTASDRELTSLFERYLKALKDENQVPAEFDIALAQWAAERAETTGHVVEPGDFFRGKFHPSQELKDKLKAVFEESVNSVGAAPAPKRVRKARSKVK